MEQRLVYRVLAVEAETAQASTFVLMPEGVNTFSYKAGQFITFLFNNKVGGEERRSYSISSVPGIDTALRITIKRVVNGTYSRWMLDHVKPGDVLWGLEPAGLFVLPEEGTMQDYCFFAAGSGIVPIYSLIRCLLLKNSTRSRIQLIYSNVSEADTIFHAALKELMQAYPDQFSIRFLFSNAHHYRLARLSGWMVEEIANGYTEKHTARFYLCGPFEYMRMIHMVLRGMGFNDEQIKREQFVIYPVTPKERPPDTQPHKVYFPGLDTPLTVQYPTTIMAAARKAGIHLPFSCESGQCGTCVATCTQGKVWMWRNEVLTDEEVAAGRVLTCTAYPVEGDVWLGD